MISAEKRIVCECSNVVVRGIISIEVHLLNMFSFYVYTHVLSDRDFQLFFASAIGEIKIEVHVM